jgi:hypothetical protein
VFQVEVSKLEQVPTLGCKLEQRWNNRKAQKAQHIQGLSGRVPTVPTVLTQKQDTGTKWTA